ncbi:MAG: hypothetical protein J0652_02590 [Desulfobulbaceae bacterium]|nr:hypothetical protein [Desulfobulbaceae bacterium]
MNGQSKIEIILSAVDKGLTTGINRAGSAVKGLFSNMSDGSRQVRTFSGALTGLLGPLLGMVSAAAGIQKLVSVSREFDKLSAGLQTATGSAQGAEESFAALQDFATRTPYDLAQVTDSFVKLVNFGLDPSERALTSYGNTSSALGKNLNQMIEAVADAATGEFERLKEFGVKSKVEGDKVSFSFRGVTTTVGKNAQEIEDYLIKLGETNFGDAMANRMKTLDGALSNLQDEWDKVFLNISKAGIGDLIADGVRIGIGALEELNAMISSGELEGYLRDIAARFSGWADDVKVAFDFVAKQFSDFTGGLDTDGRATVDSMIESFRRFPENVRAFIGLMTVTVAAGFDRVTAYSKAFKQGVAAIFTSDTVAGVGAHLERELAVINEARESSIQAILEERDTDIQASDDRIAAAKKLRAEFDAGRAAAKADTSDKTAKFRVSGDGQQPGTAAKEDTSAKREAAASAKEAATAAKKEYEEQKKNAAERLRAASQEKIVALEMERLDASTLPSVLARAEAELAINRKMMAERVSLKQQELAAIKADTEASQADIIKAESELSEMRLEVARQELDGQRAIASEQLSLVEDTWRRGTGSVQEYQAAVQSALSLGVIDKEEADRRMILSSDNMTEALKLGFSDWAATVQTDAEFVAGMFGQVANSIGSGLAAAFNSMADGSKSAKDAMLDLARSTISMVAQMIAQQLIYNAIKSAGSAFGFSTGGPVPAFAGGGMVGGWSPSSKADNIPAWLTAREFVQPVASVDYYGAPFMEAVRRRLFPRSLARALSGMTLPRIPSGNRLAEGGMASGSNTSTTFKGGDTRLKVVNVIDKHMVGDFMRTADGETALINMIRRNGSTIRTIIGA